MKLWVWNIWVNGDLKMLTININLSTASYLQFKYSKFNERYRYELHTYYVLLLRICKSI